MAETNLAFSKVVATPTPTAWSQAYSAGKLFAVLSLTIDTVPPEGQEYLNTVGKDTISTLESEFFTLESKNLESIKQALLVTTEKIDPKIGISMVVCFLSDNILYLFASGSGKAVLKRGEKMGTVLQAEDDASIKSASGYVQEGDVIVLQTKAFQRIIQPPTLASSLDTENPEDIAENLAPHVHDKSEGGASAIILLYKKVQPETPTIAPVDNPEESSITESEDVGELNEDGSIPIQDLDEKGEEINIAGESQDKPALEETMPEPVEPQPIQNYYSETSNLEVPDGRITAPDEMDNEESNLPVGHDDPLTQTPPTTMVDQSHTRSRLEDSQNSSRKFSFPLPKGMPSRKKLMLGAVILLAALIVITSVMAIANRGRGEDKALFAEAYAEAQEKYDEGINLKDLNGPLAQDSFLEAKEILDRNINNFDEDSEERRQMSELLAKVNAELEGAGGNSGVSAEEAEKTDSELLSVALDNSGASYFIENEDFVYFLDGAGIQRVDKGNNDKEEIIKKAWEEEGGIGIFGSNVYVLDKEDNILKFTPSGNTYSESDYFTADAPNLGNAKAMAIDGSVYVLTGNSINKYTRGEEDEFSITGLDTNLSSPTRIFTNEDTDNIYVLDNGNSRIVVLNKTGGFVKAYSADIIKAAKEFDVDEANNQVFILSGGKIYKISLT